MASSWDGKRSKLEAFNVSLEAARERTHSPPPASEQRAEGKVQLSTPMRIGFGQSKVARIGQKSEEAFKRDAERQ